MTIKANPKIEDRKRLNEKALTKEKMLFLIVLLWYEDWDA